MGRKASTAAAEKPSSPRELKTLIEDHSLFFDNLVKLIPARFYIPGPDDDEKPWFQGLSKAAKASAKKQSRKNIKKSRRNRFNPETPTSTLDILQKTIKSDQNPSSKGDDQSVTYEELRQRLHRRIEMLRSKRNTRPQIEPRSEPRTEPRNDRKRKAEDKSEGKKEKDEILPDIAYGKVKVGEDEGRMKRRKKLSKAQELEKAKRLQELKKDPEKGETVTKKHSWKAAESRAMGMKVHDDPKQLKESIKKEKTRQKKHAEKWKERVESTENLRKEKQKKRTENIKERIQQKKTRRIEKREKKLMRPGFEGRKEGYINK